MFKAHRIYFFAPEKTSSLHYKGKREGEREPRLFTDVYKAIYLKNKNVPSFLTHMILDPDTYCCALEKY